jgi:hypothetical protein
VRSCGSEWVGGTDRVSVYDGCVQYLLIALVAGCGFQVGLGGQNPPGDADADDAPADATIDGEIDAPVDPPIDAPITMVDAPCADDDDDSVCNELDTWPCGAQPQAPGSPITLEETQGSDLMRVRLSNTALSGGQRLHTVAPGGTFTVSADYSIVDCICEGCIDQIQIGLVPGTTKQCLYSGNPGSPCQTATTGNASRTLTAPTTPGVYEVRFRLGQDFDCDGQQNNNTGWWTNVPPGPNQTVALVCVD